MWRLRKIAVLTLLLINIYRNRNRKTHRVRRYGVIPFNKLRSLYGQYETMVQYMKTNDEKEFFSYTMMKPYVFDHLLGLVTPKLTKHPNRKNALSPSFRLCLTLHYLAEGCSMKEISRNYYIGKATTHVIIREVCTALWDVLKETYLPEPTFPRMSAVAEGFMRRWNMPNCIGALDGKHVTIQAPYHSGSEYFSYKKSFSLILMAVCDADYKFVYVDIGAPGAFHDSYVFRESNFGKAFLNNQMDTQLPGPRQLPHSNISLPHFVVADQAFPLHTRIMRPYPGQRLGVNKNIFNYRLSRARRAIENTFGILAQRWRILRKPIIGDIETCTKVVQAVVILHNYVQSSEREVSAPNRTYCPPGLVDEEHSGEVTPGAWREDAFRLASVGRIGANIASRNVQENRDVLCEYFVSDVGAVPWQWHQVLRGGAP